MYKKKFQSTTVNYSTSETITEIVFYGSASDIQSLKEDYSLNEVYADGALKSLVTKRVSPNIHEASLSFKIATDGSSNIDNPDDYNYGEKSCTLSGTLLPMPLESHPDYKVCWNYFLAGAPEYDTIPSNWGSTTSLSISDSNNLAWIKNASELPTTNGKRWKILAEPIKPGVTHYDKATYSISENVKCISAANAGNVISNNLNQIGTPSETFNITGGNWKCDDAKIQWNGKYWLASLVWTKSGDNSGWDSDLYTGE